MPELPEVEVVRRELAKLRAGTIIRLESRDSRVFVCRANVVGRVVREVRRRGKWLRLDLDEAFIFSHLGMTGDWTLRRANDAELPFERVRMDVDRAGSVLSARYIDARRFGRFVATDQEIAAWRDLGPDPLLDGIDEERVFARMKKSKRAVKALLLDQTLLAGVGNILAIEALWNAQIDPRVRANRMDARDVRAIAKGLRAIITRTIAYDEKMLGARRHLKTPFRIYGRANDPCPRCGAILTQKVLAGRGTTFCPGCQHAHAPGGRG